MFCKYCGTQLDENQLCTCESAQQEHQQQQTVARSSQQIQDAALKSTAIQFLQEIRRTIFAYFKDPVQTIDGAVKQNSMRTAHFFSLLCILGISLSTFGIINGFKNIGIDYINKILMYSGAGSNFYTSGTNAKQLIEVDFFGFILWGTIITLLCMALSVFLALAINRSMKGASDIKSIYIGNSINSMAPTILLLASFLVSFISLKIAAYMILAACFCWIVYGAITAQYFSPDKSSGKIWLIYFAGVLIIALVCWYAIPKLLWNAVGETSIFIASENVSMTLHEIIDGAIGELKSAVADIPSELYSIFSELSDLIS